MDLRLDIDQDVEWNNNFRDVGVQCDACKIGCANADGQINDDYRDFVDKPCPTAP